MSGYLNKATVRDMKKLISLKEIALVIISSGQFKFETIQFRKWTFIYF